MKIVHTKMKQLRNNREYAALVTEKSLLEILVAPESDELYQGYREAYLEGHKAAIKVANLMDTPQPEDNSKRVEATVQEYESTLDNIALTFFELCRRLYKANPTTRMSDQEVRIFGLLAEKISAAVYYSLRPQRGFGPGVSSENDRVVLVIKKSAHKWLMEEPYIEHYETFMEIITSEHPALIVK